MHKGIFITGTDTGVGKTFFAAGLIRALKRAGHDVCPLKPVETGCRMRRGELFPSDTSRLIRASGVQETADTVNPFRFRLPLAPAVASEIEGRSIRKTKIISSYNRLRKRYDIILIEGAGGVFVPLYRKYLMVDLMKDLNVPALVVARPGLGTINHTLLTINALHLRGIKVLGVIMNNTTRSRQGMPEKTNPRIIETLSACPVLGTVPFIRNASADNCQREFDLIAEKIMSAVA